MYGGIFAPIRSSSSQTPNSEVAAAGKMSTLFHPTSRRARLRHVVGLVGCYCCCSCVQRGTVESSGSCFAHHGHVIIIMAAEWEIQLKDTRHTQRKRAANKHNYTHHSQRSRAARRHSSSPSGRRHRPHWMLALRVLTLVTPQLLDLWERGAHETRRRDQRARETY